jgi:phosphoribosylformimino-5-aminoimidazole carboxamide ribotide isomerase
MRVIPVLDLIDGKVVHAIGGRRQEYQPIVSKWTTSVQAKEVARALTEQYGFREFYVADLDAIAGRTMNCQALDELRSLGLHCWLDGGIRDVARARQAAELADTVVVGLETIDGPDALRAITSELSVPRLVFSLDLRAGQPLGGGDVWDHASPQEIAGQVLSLGVERVLVLDLARVGSNNGPGSLDLCQWLIAEPACRETSLGGGVRGPGDLQSLHQLGINAVLVASALRDGRIAPEDLQKPNLIARTSFPAQ